MVCEVESFTALATVYEVLILVLMEYGLREGQICKDLYVSPLQPKKPQNPKILRENMYL